MSKVFVYQGSFKLFEDMGPMGAVGTTGDFDGVAASGSP